MLNLFDDWQRGSIDLVRSQKIAGIKVPTVVINDDGFLPAEVDSPIKQYRKQTGEPLYFDQVQVPRFWQIKGDASGAQVYDLNAKRAEIRFFKNDNTRFVKQVEWLNATGELQWIDQYDQHGQRFAKTFYAKGQAKLKQYYDAAQNVVIDHHLTTDDIFLYIGGRQRHFANWLELTANFLQKSDYQLDHIIYNTLNQAFFTTLKLPNKNASDVLVWQEGLGNELPGNMRFIFENQTRTKQIWMQNYQAWVQYQEKFAKPVDTDSQSMDVKVQQLGTIYPHPRGNQMRPAILIMTNSDQIEMLSVLAARLKNFDFHVAALTEMSEKLLQIGEQANVHLYPTVSFAKAKQLMADCDIYLDINRGDQIMDAVRAAFENNQLILGFNDTLHLPELVAPDNRYDEAQLDTMIEKLLLAMVKPAVMEQLIDSQREFAGDAKVETYQKRFSELRS